MLYVKCPTLGSAAVATMALGVGANSAIFSVVSGVLLKPLAYDHPERIVAVECFWKNTGKTSPLVSAPDFHDWRAQNRVFAFLAYHKGGAAATVANGVADFAEVQRVTPDFFHVFGLRPAAGRFWSSEENRSQVAVVSHLWAVRLGGAKAALGASIKVQGKILEVIGVAATGFRYPAATEIWIPAGLFGENPHRSGHSYLAIGRLKPDVSLDAARREMREIGDRLEREYPDQNRFKTVAVIGLHEKLTTGVEATLWVLLGAVGAVLLIACANVANLQLARSTSRTREMAVRSALGAGRSRIVRQVLTESAVVGVFGAAAGLGVAALAIKGLVALAPADVPRIDEVRIDGPVLLFGLAIALVCSLLFGLASARHVLRRAVNDGMRLGGKGMVGRASGRMQSVLVAAQVALCAVLLAGGGLLLRSFVALTRTDLGFATERLLLTRMSTPVNTEDDARRATELRRDMLERLRALPGVTRAAGVQTQPFAGVGSISPYFIEGEPPRRPGEGPEAVIRVITPQYFATMGIPLKLGRDFTDSDAFGRPQTAMISEELAKAAFGSGNPLGRRIRCVMSLQEMDWMEIIGVVEDSRQVSPGEPPRPELYLPYLQHPSSGSNLKLLTRTAIEPESLMSAIRQIVREMAPEAPVRFSEMDETLAEALAYPRFRAVLIGAFALMATLLALVGIYGVISYLVGQRTSEIGLRIAIGARGGDIFRLIVGAGLRMAMVGLAIGLAGAFAVAGVLDKFLYGVEARDAAPYVCVVAALGVTALLASGIPALRAARVDPVVALRQE